MTETRLCLKICSCTMQRSFPGVHAMRRDRIGTSFSVSTQMRAANQQPPDTRGTSWCSERAASFSLNSLRRSLWLFTAVALACRFSTAFCCSSHFFSYAVLVSSGPPSSADLTCGSRLERSRPRVPIRSGEWVQLCAVPYRGTSPASSLRELLASSPPLFLFFFFLFRASSFQCTTQTVRARVTAQSASGCCWL